MSYIWSYVHKGLLVTTTATTKEFKEQLIKEYGKSLGNKIYARARRNYLWVIQYFRKD